MNENISLTFNVDANTQAAEASIENAKKKYEGEQIKLEVGLGKDTLTPAINEIIHNSTGKFSIDIDDSRFKKTIEIIETIANSKGKSIAKTFSKAVSSTLNNDNAISRIIEEKMGKGVAVNGKNLKNTYDILKKEVQDFNIGELVSKQDYDQLVLVINKYAEMEALFQKIQKVAKSTSFEKKGFTQQTLLNNLNSLNVDVYAQALEKSYSSLAFQMENLKKLIAQIPSITDGKFSTNFDKAYQSNIDSILAKAEERLNKAKEKYNYEEYESSLQEIFKTLKSIPDNYKGDSDKKLFNKKVEEYILGGGKLSTLQDEAKNNGVFDSMLFDVSKTYITRWQKQRKEIENLQKEYNTQVERFNGSGNGNGSGTGNGNGNGSGTGNGNGNGNGSDTSEETSKEQKATSEASKSETSDFETITQAVEDLKSAINDKTNAINNEKSAMTEAKESEVQDLADIAKAAKDAKSDIEKSIETTTESVKDDAINSVNKTAEDTKAKVEADIKARAEDEARIKAEATAIVEKERQVQAQLKAVEDAKAEKERQAQAEAEAKTNAEVQAKADEVAQKQSAANKTYSERNKYIKEWIALKNKLVKVDKDTNPAYATELQKQADDIRNNIYNGGRRLKRAVKNGYFDADKLQSQNDSYTSGKIDAINSGRILNAQKKDEANLKLANEINEAKEKEIALSKEQEKSNSNKIYVERNRLLAEWVSLQKNIDKLDNQSNPAYAQGLKTQAEYNMNRIDALGKQLEQYRDDGNFDANKLKSQNAKIVNSQIGVNKAYVLNEAKKQDEADLKIVKDIESARKQELALIKESYALRIKLDKETNSWNFNDNENDSNVVKALKSKLDGVEKQSDKVGKYLHNAFINNPDGRAEYLETLGNAISESELDRAANLEKQQQAFLKKNGANNFDNISTKRDSEYQTQLASKANAKLEELNQSYISTEISNKQYIDRFNQLKDTLKKDLELSNKFDDIKKSVGDIYKVSKSKYRDSQDVGNLEDVAISSLQAYSKMNEIYKTNPTKTFEDDEFKKNLAIVNQNRKIIEAVRNEKHYAGNISKDASQAEIDNFIKKDMSSISGEKYSNVKILKTTDDYAKGLKKVSVQAQDAKGVLHNFQYTLDGTLVTMKDTTNMSFTKRGGILGFIDAVKSKSSELAAYWTSNLLNPYQLIGVFQQGFAKVRELDTAFVEMRKVSNDSIDSLQKFKNESFGIGESIGTTGLQMQSSAADFMRLGYNLDSASVLSKDANIYKNVGDMDIESATEHMISSIKAWGSEFNSDVEASGAIVDRYNEIGNNFSITSAGIGSAMEKSASALKAGGNTLNEALGLIVAGNEVTQDPDTVANAIKVGSLRIRGAKTELAAMGEDTDGLASSTSKLREELKNLTGVDIMKDSKTFKSTAQIYEEIGKIFDGLSDVSQANVLEKLFGKTRASVGAGLLENYETIQDVINSAENADGSALKENATYMDSIEGKMSKLSTEAEEFWSDLIDSGSAKDLIDILASILDKFDSILKVATKLGGLPGLVGGAIGFGVGKSGYGKRTIEILNVTNVLCPLL